jgi:hypothetical protein
LLGRGWELAQSSRRRCIVTPAIALTGAVVSTTEVPGSPVDMALAAGSVWFSGPIDDIGNPPEGVQLVRFNAIDGVIEAELNVASSGL